jgi:hypothetical protein
MLLKAHNIIGSRVEGETPKPARTTAGAVVLTYASQDSEAVHWLRDSLRAAGVIWCDQSEPRGGEVWQRQIRVRGKSEEKRLALTLR